MAAQWFVLVDETVEGPISGKKLKRLAIKGHLLPQMRVRQGVDGEWVAAAEISRLFDDTSCRSADSIPIQGGERFYQTSQSVPTFGIVLVSVIGIPVSLLLGSVYGVLEAINPLKQASILATMALPKFISVLATGICSYTNVRNGAFRVLSGFALGCLAVYSSWVFSLWTYSDFNFEFLVWDPIALMELIELAADKGLWKMQGAAAPTGSALYLIWAVEAGLIVGCSTIMSFALDDGPFCEDCSCWTEEFQDVWRFSSAASSTVFVDLVAERYQVLFDYQDEILDEDDHLVGDLHECPQCNQSNYLTVRHRENTYDEDLILDDGKVHTTDRKLVKFLRIPTELVAELVPDVPENVG